VKGDVVGKHLAIATAGCGAAAVSLLLFAGCKDSGGGDSPSTPGVVSTETQNSAGPGNVTVPPVHPPPRPSSSVTEGGCGMEGLTCTETTTTTASDVSDISEPDPAETTEPSE
jgi:hypothetical protein